MNAIHGRVGEGGGGTQRNSKLKVRYLLLVYLTELLLQKQAPMEKSLGFDTNKIRALQ